MTSDQRRREANDAPACRKTTDFTIEHILNRAGTSPQRHDRLLPGAAGAPADHCYQEAQELHDAFDARGSGSPFTWLQCTRYCPPRVPRRREGPQKRQLGRHPRIPFTSHQLSVLEDKFRQSPYLSSDEVTRISRALELADIRVKIWFQNRRARERREKLGLSPPRTTTPPSSPPKQPPSD